MTIRIIHGMVYASVGDEDRGAPAGTRDEAEIRSWHDAAQDRVVGAAVRAGRIRVEPVDADATALVDAVGAERATGGGRIRG